MSDYNIQYKIIILKMLDMSGGSLNTDLITSFFIENSYTDYFTVQQTIYELIEQKMISTEASSSSIGEASSNRPDTYTENNIVSTDNSNSTNYFLTDEGKKTLALMSDRITSGIKRDLKNYFSKNSLEIKETKELSSSYDSSTSGGFIVHLSLGKKGNKEMDISIKVPTEDLAKTLVFNWKSHFDKVYESIIDALS